MPPPRLRGRSRAKRSGRGPVSPRMQELVTGPLPGAGEQKKRGGGTMARSRNATLGTLIGVVLAIALQAYPLSTTASAQAPSTSGYDPSLRSLQYYSYKRVAESGPERGRELYYFKCWQCHNEFQKTAPQLTGLYQGGRQIAGQPVTDAVV